MRSKISKKILSETSKETKDKVNDYANKLVLSGVSKSFYCGSAVFVGSSCQSECNTCKGLNKPKQ